MHAHRFIYLTTTNGCGTKFIISLSINELRTLCSARLTSLPMEETVFGVGGLLSRFTDGST